MDSVTRVAIISMIIDCESVDSINSVNSLLQEYAMYIKGRLGVPYHERGVNIISVVVDAPEDKISALSGKLGRLNGVTSKAVYSKKKD